MRRAITILTSLAALTGLLAGCPTRPAGPPPGPSAEVLQARAPTSDPAIFLDHLITLARAGDEQGWVMQLSQTRRARGPAYGARHFQAWRQDLLGLAGGLGASSPPSAGAALAPAPRPRVRLERRGDPPRAALVLVVGEQRLMRLRLEGGALKIDEN